MEAARFASRIPIELQDLFRCDCCQQPFNNTDAMPKLLPCRHYFCAACLSTKMLITVDQIVCMHCSRNTDIWRGVDALPTKSSIFYLVCNIELIRFPAQLTLTSSSAVTSPLTTGALQPYKRQSQSQSQSPQHRPLQLVELTGNRLQQRTGVSGGENCHTHAMPNSLWCRDCQAMMCRGCAATGEHRGHNSRPYAEQHITMRSDLKDEQQAIKCIILQLENLTERQREVQLEVLQVCNVLRTQLESNRHKHRQKLELTAAWDVFDHMGERMAQLDGRPPTEAGTLFEAMHAERIRLQTRTNALFAQCRLDELIGCGVPLNDSMIRNMMGGEVTDGWPAAALTATLNGDNVAWKATVLLGNFCMVQLYASQDQERPLMMEFSQCQLTDSPLDLPDVVLAKLLAASKSAPSARVTPDLMSNNQQQLMQPIASTSSMPIAFRASTNPVYYFDIQIDGLDMGRFLIEVFTDRAPDMALNFDLLVVGNRTTGSYKGCQIFQCWENESIITGDTEMNTGQGGRSAFTERLFMPDDSKLRPIPGSVGMRRSQKKRDQHGLVGSQFRVILSDMSSFSAIFGHVKDGLGLVRQISRTGDAMGRPHSVVTVADCGRL